MAGLWKLVDATSGPISTRSVTGCQGGEDGPHLPWTARWLAIVAVEQVVAGPDRVEPDALRQERHLAQLRPAHLALDLGKLDADLDRGGILSPIEAYDPTR